MTTTATQAVRAALPPMAVPLPVPVPPVPVAPMTVLAVNVAPVNVAAVLPGRLARPDGWLTGDQHEGAPRRRSDMRVFAGRRRELDVLAAELAAAVRGSPRLVVLEGEPGLGKSALISEFLAGQDQLPLLAASGDEAEQALPYGLVRQLAGGLADGLPASCRMLAAGPAAAADPLAVGAELHAVLAARHPAGRRVVIIEDLQWADQPSASALLYACRRLTAGQILVIVSGRPLGLRRLGEGWARFLQTERGCRRLSLSGLGTPELTELAVALGRASLPDRALRQVAACSEGSPALASALLSELPDRVLSGPLSQISAPDSVAASVAPRLAALRDDAADLVIAAAVLGERCALSDAALLSGAPVADDALDLAAGAGFLIAEPVTRQVRFAHELIRRAVYANMGASRRRSLHRWAAALTDGPDALRHRVAAARGPDLRLAAELDAAAASAAADAAAGRGEPGRAARYLIQAAELGAQGPARTSRLLAAFELLVRSGDVAAAESLCPLAESLPDGTRRDASLGQLALLAARPAEAEILLLRAWDTHQRDARQRAAQRAPDADQAAAVAAAASLAILYARAGLPAQARRWASRSAPTAGSRQADPALLGLQASALLMAGQAARAGQLLAALPAVAAMVPAAQSDALTVRGTLRLRGGDAAGAADDLCIVAAWIRAGLPVRQPAQALGCLAEASFRLGRWDDCQQLAELAVGMARDAGRVSELPFAHSAAIPAAALRGDWQLASAHLLAAQEAARTSGGGLAARHAAAARAVLSFARSDPAEVLKATGPVITMPGTGQGDPLIRLWQPVRIWALIRTGALDLAEQALDELDRCPAVPGADVVPGTSAVPGDRAAPGDPAVPDDVATLVYAAWLRASLALARNLPETAERVLSGHSELAASVSDPLARALFEVEFGRCLARLHRRPAALARLRAGHEILAGLQARPLAEAAAAELAALGMRARSDADHGLPGLTAQELQVARLVGGGMSNREAAAQLHLSPKTIEYHLAHIFAKLGIRTRYQLAARLRQRLVPAGEAPGSLAS